MEEQQVKAHGATTGTMFTYGLGSIPVGIKNNLLGTYLLIYYNQVLGLDAMLAASAMSIALVVDAITDPWSDCHVIPCADDCEGEEQEAHRRGRLSRR